MTQSLVASCHRSGNTCRYAYSKTASVGATKRGVRGAKLFGENNLCTLRFRLVATTDRGQRGQRPLNHKKEAPTINPGKEESLTRVET